VDDVVVEASVAEDAEITVADEGTEIPEDVEEITMHEVGSPEPAAEESSEDPMDDDVPAEPQEPEPEPA
jgi:hypothetical protein